MNDVFLDTHLNKDIIILKKCNLLSEQYQVVLGKYKIKKIYEHYILCDNGLYTACFLKVDFSNKELIIYNMEELENERKN